jgi:outer membrane protein assembly factor BamB
MKKVSLPIYFLSISALFGCAGGNVSVMIPDQKAIPSSVNLPKGVKRVWNKRVPGSLTDLAVARVSGHTLIATAPDRDAKIQTNTPILLKFDSQGKQMWQLDLPARVRSFSISSDGSFVVVTDYDSRLTAYNKFGKKLWSEDDFCQPILLEKSKRILCYHDDDSDPDTIFTVYGWNGKRLHTQKTKDDVLVLKISRDEKYIAYGSVGGKTYLLDDQFKTLWSSKVGGEIVHLMISDAPNPRVAVLYDATLKKTTVQQDIAVFDLSGQLRAEGKTPNHVEKIELSARGNDLFVYGNSVKGQFLGFYPLLAKFEKKSVLNLKPAWSREDPKYADYSSHLFLSKNLAVFGHDATTPTTRYSQLVGYDFAGKLKWNIPISGDEGAYLQLYGFTENVSTIVAGMDDGTLNMYRVD